MIIGIGVDVIEVERLQRVIARHGKQFLNHVYTTAEQAAAPAGAGQAAYYAGRWAAKEAVAKALGTGIGADCGWCDIEVSNNSAGQPKIKLQETAARTAARRGIESIHISISHERRLACASAVGEGCSDNRQSTGVGETDHHC